MRWLLPSSCGGRIRLAEIAAVPLAVACFLVFSWMLPDRGGAPSHALADGLAGGLTEPAPSTSLPSLTRDAEETRAEVAAVRTPSEARPAPDSEQDSSSLDLEVHWDDGSPLVHAQVFIRAEGELIRQGTTNHSGRAEFAPIERAGAVLHVAQGSLELVHSDLPAGSGPISIEVPLRSSVQGSATVNGLVPDPPVQLQLSTFQGEVGLGAVESSLRKPQDLLLRQSVIATTETDEAGHFTFGGLSPEWRGELVPRGGYRLAEGGTGLRLDAPSATLALELVPPALLEGRVLSPTGDPVPHCPIELELHGPFASNRTRRESDGEGRFRIGIPSEVWDSAELSFRAPGIGFRKLETELDLIRGADLGDVVLHTARGVTAIITDLDGHPIEGARIRWEGIQSEGSDADGSCRLASLPPGELSLVAEAPGFVPKAFPLPDAWGARAAPDDDPLAIALRPVTSLEIHVVDADGETLEGAVLRVSARPLFLLPAGEDLPADWGRNDAVEKRGEVSSDEGGVRNTTVFLDTRTGGRAVLSPVSPDVPIQIRVLDSAEEPLGWEETVLLKEGESRTLEARVPTTLHSLFGSVVDAAGVPVMGAEISLLDPPGVRARTDATGAFRVEPLLPETLSLLVRARGFAPRLLPDAPTDTPIPIRLETGREHTVHIVDDAGRSVHASQVLVIDHGTTILQARAVADGRYHFEDLPVTPVELIAVVDGEGHTALASNGSETTITIPTPGSLFVFWNPGFDTSAAYLVTVRSKTAPGRRVWRNLGPEEFEAGGVCFESLTPDTYEVSCFVDSPSHSAPGPAAEGEIEVPAGKRVEIRFDP
ncbi:MAG TPA: carboxypeptidase regulatory-like domain-containing protein [Planctomycetes bacterium]|nr:carboxypeptidase regulatory-like domain-containing protein [Planctomycetota bacterium]